VFQVGSLGIRIVARSVATTDSQDSQVSYTCASQSHSRRLFASSQVSHICASRLRIHSSGTKWLAFEAVKERRGIVTKLATP